MAHSMQAAQIRILMACLVKGGFKRKLFRGDFLSQVEYCHGAGVKHGGVVFREVAVDVPVAMQGVKK